MLPISSTAPSRLRRRGAAIDHLAVVIPAHDEAATIGACLYGIERARQGLPTGVSSSVVVVADRCSDETVELALAALRGRDGDVVLEATAGSAGAARRLGTRCALRAAATTPERIWVANTDADTVVSAHWLTTQLTAAADGFIALAGVVDLEASTVRDPRLVELFDEYYVRHPDGTHPHIHGANLGFRADAYEAAGGWNPLASGEDHDLWQRLRRHGPVRSSIESLVSTSARLRGRAPACFAADLAALMSRLEIVA